MKNDPLRGVLIDLDGTLMDTAPDLALAANRMRADFGLSPLSQQRIAAFVGKGSDVLVHRALTDDMNGKLDDERFARGHEAFYRHYHAVNGEATVVFDDAAAAVDRLHAAGLRVACVTNKPREFTLPLLERMGLRAHFDAVVAGDDVEEKKPHPALVLAGCNALGVGPAGAVMIGDSVNDAKAADAAGCRVVLVETGYNEGESVAALRDAPGVDAILPTLAQAVDWLLETRAAKASDRS